MEEETTASYERIVRGRAIASRFENSAILYETLLS